MHARMLRFGLLVTCSSLIVACGGSNSPAEPPPNPTVDLPPPPEPPTLESIDAGATSSPVLTPDPQSAKPAATIKGASDKLKFVASATPFGSGKGTDASLVGLVFRTQAAPSALPDFSKMRPIGVLFTNTLEIAPGTAFVGFPGFDKARSTEFAIRYEGPLNVGREGDYEIRMVSDDGAKLFIDEMLIVDNDGAATSEAKTGKATVHLVKARHTIRLDYFQAAGDVALQLFATPPGGSEAPLKTNLF